MTRTKHRLWRCPRCGRRFVNRNQWHSCRWVPLRLHFKGKGAHARRLFEAFCAAVRQVARAKGGPLRLSSNKTRIGFQARMHFAAVTVHKASLRGGLCLARAVRNASTFARHGERQSNHKRFFKVESFSPRNHVHHFRLDRPANIDRRFRHLLAQAYAVGQQEHLRRGRKDA